MARVIVKQVIVAGNRVTCYAHDPNLPGKLNPAQLVALVDALGNGTLNDNQRQVVHTLRAGLVRLAQQEQASPVAAGGLSG